MWVFFPTGFVSIVADRAQPNGPALLVRARTAEHLERFLEKLPGPVAERPAVEHTPEADYHYRAWVPRWKVSRVMASLATDLRYANFKAAIPETEDAYHDAAMKTWQAMWDCQARVELRERREASQSDREALMEAKIARIVGEEKARKAAIRHRRGQAKRKAQRSP